MMQRLILIAAASAFAISSCKTKCKVTCAAQVVPVAVGFKFEELDTVQLSVYTANSGFVTPIHNQFFLNKGANTYPVWHATDMNTLADTMYMNSASILNSLDYSLGNYDIQVKLYGAHRVFRFSSVVFDGAYSENQSCSHGDPTPGFCNRYITTYKDSDTVYTFSAGSNTGHIYMVK